MYLLHAVFYLAQDEGLVRIQDLLSSSNVPALLFLLLLLCKCPVLWVLQLSMVLRTSNELHLQSPAKICWTENHTVKPRAGWQIPQYCWTGTHCCTLAASAAQYCSGNRSTIWLLSCMCRPWPCCLLWWRATVALILLISQVTGTVAQASLMTAEATIPVVRIKELVVGIGVCVDSVLARSAYQIVCNQSPTHNLWNYKMNIFSLSNVLPLFSPPHPTSHTAHPPPNRRGREIYDFVARCASQKTNGNARVARY